MSEQNKGDKPRIDVMTDKWVDHRWTTGLTNDQIVDKLEKDFPEEMGAKKQGEAVVATSTNSEGVFDPGKVALTDEELDDPYQNALAIKRASFRYSTRRK